VLREDRRTELVLRLHDSNGQRLGIDIGDLHIDNVVSLVIKMLKVGDRDPVIGHRAQDPILGIVEARFGGIELDLDHGRSRNFVQAERLRLVVRSDPHQTKDAERDENADPNHQPVRMAKEDWQ